MKKKIAKLESKIKSYDKVTVRKGTQTTEVFDKVEIYSSLQRNFESLNSFHCTLRDLKCSKEVSKSDLLFIFKCVDIKKNIRIPSSSQLLVSSKHTNHCIFAI